MGREEKRIPCGGVCAPQGVLRHKCVLGVVLMFVLIRRIEESWGLCPGHSGSRSTWGLEAHAGPTRQRVGRTSQDF